MFSKTSLVALASLESRKSACLCPLGIWIQALPVITLYFCGCTSDPLLGQGQAAGSPRDSSEPPLCWGSLELLHQAVGDVAAGRLTGTNDLHNLWEQAQWGLAGPQHQWRGPTMSSGHGSPGLREREEPGGIRNQQFPKGLGWEEGGGFSPALA